MSSQPLLEIQNLNFSFGHRPVIQNLNWSVLPGEVVAILGASGSGKSTLLRILAGLLPEPLNAVRWNFDHDKKAGARKEPTRFGFVFQDSQLLAWRTALENVLLPLELQSQSMPHAERIAIARAALAQVNLNKAENLFPHELSGGMKMRVSIARALAARPQVLFMDEPFSALDEVARFKLQEELRLVAERNKLTVFFVTHSSYEAVFLADRVVLLENGAIQSDRAIRHELPRSQALRASGEYLQEVESLFSRMQKGAE